MREGACIGSATMLQPWTLRLILNDAALAAATQTLLFRLATVKCASVSRWACRKRRRKNSPCMQLDVLMIIN